MSYYERHEHLTFGLIGLGLLLMVIFCGLWFKDIRSGVRMVYEGEVINLEHVPSHTRARTVVDTDINGVTTTRQVWDTTPDKYTVVILADDGRVHLIDTTPELYYTYRIGQRAPYVEGVGRSGIIWYRVMYDGRGS